MRLTNLLLVIVALLTAPAASFAQTILLAKSNAADFTGDTAAVIHPDGSSPASDKYGRAHRNLDSADSSQYCLTMRTYVVARDNPAADSTHMAGYHECVPAWKFDMRTANEKAPRKPIEK
jgi:hypothetical protein